MNNAGIGIYAPTLDHTKKQLDDMVNTNILGPVFMVQSVIPYMPQGGRIINISSSMSRMGPAQMPVYAATKAYLDSLSYSWAAEVRA